MSTLNVLYTVYNSLEILFEMDFSSSTFSAVLTVVAARHTCPAANTLGISLPQTFSKERKKRKIFLKIILNSCTLK